MIDPAQEWTEQQRIIADLLAALEWYAGMKNYGGRARAAIAAAHQGEMPKCPNLPGHETHSPPCGLMQRWAAHQGEGRVSAVNVSVETVERADALATTVLSLVDVLATGQRSVNDILADAIEQADEYRRSRLAAAHQGEGT